MKNLSKSGIAVLLTGCILSSGLTGCNSNTGGSLETESNNNDGSARVTVNTNTASLGDDAKISDTLFGLFLEDINYAVDAGLYTELIKNQSFEYGSLAANTNRHGWLISSDEVTFDISSEGASDCLNEANPTYAIITNSSDTKEGIGNRGYLDGLAVTKDAEYSASLYMRANDGFSGEVTISLENTDGTVYAEETFTGITKEWWKYETTLTPNETVNDNLRLYIRIDKGSIDVDMVSLMPTDTYKGLPIRKDLGEYLEALNPSFLRFPGGCAIEGRDEESMYNWKDSVGNGTEFVINGETTVGDIAVRPRGKDIWVGSTNNPYYTTYGIGFYEYFCLCEALDCLPMPVLNAGMTCQVQSPTYIVYPIGSEEFNQCVQDALDLVEFCRGDETTEWGKVRIAMGHEEPFELKYVCIGNEQWQAEYHEHYYEFVLAFDNAAKENPDMYSDIELCVANGTASGSREGWSYLSYREGEDLRTTLVDEHYYQTPDWFLKNTFRYDSYDRSSQAKVFLGEYAAQSNNLQAALAEAAYTTGLERNGDIVAMACYAPLFGNSTTNQWLPDMIFFSNEDAYGTINYYVQKMFANNIGTLSLPYECEYTEPVSDSAFSGGVGLGSWCTSVAYDNLKVEDLTTGDIIYEADFEDSNTLDKDNWNVHEGNWKIENGRLIQTNTGDPANGNTGDSIYIGDNSWSNYKMTVEAKILSGAEGFLIPICFENTANHIFWNLGGWGNTVSCLQIVEANSKSGQVDGTVKNCTLNKNQVYTLSVIVKSDCIECYVDDVLYLTYKMEAAPTFFVASSMDENNDIILKLVNAGSESIAVDYTLEDIDFSLYDTTALVTTLSGDDLGAINGFDATKNILPQESTTTVAEQFKYTIPKYSYTVIRIKAK